MEDDDDGLLLCISSSCGFDLNNCEQVGGGGGAAVGQMNPKPNVIGTRNNRNCLMILMGKQIVASLISITGTFLHCPPIHSSLVSLSLFPSTRFGSNNIDNNYDGGTGGLW